MLLMPSPLRTRQAARWLLDALRRAAGPVQDPTELHCAPAADTEPMAAEIDAFVYALNEDLITADDFRR